MNVLKLLTDYGVPVDVVELILRFVRARVRETLAIERNRNQWFRGS